MKFLAALVLLAGSAFAQQAKVVVVAPDFALTKIKSSVDDAAGKTQKRNTYMAHEIAAGDHTLRVSSVRHKATASSVRFSAKPGETIVFVVDRANFYVGEIVLRRLDDQQAQDALKSHRPAL